MMFVLLGCVEGEPCLAEGVLGFDSDGDVFDSLEQATFGADKVVRLCAGVFRFQAAPGGTDDVHIVGAGMDATILEGGGFRVLDVRSSGSITVSDLTVRLGVGSFSEAGLAGGGTIAPANPTLFERVRIEGNQADVGAGVLVSHGGHLEIRDSVVVGNNAAGAGGGAALFGPDTRLESVNTAWGTESDNGPDDVAMLDEYAAVVGSWVFAGADDFICDSEEGTCE